MSMGKRDRLLIGGILVLALVLAGVWLLLRRSGGYVVVRVDGAETARYSLSEEGTYALNGGSNVLRIEDGTAWLTDADCPDRLCVKQGKVRYDGQTITCLPNRLTVTVYSGEEDGVDLAMR